MTDLKTQFNKWWEDREENPDTHETLETREDAAREAFYAAYELGMNKGFEMGKQVGVAVGMMEHKIKTADE